jgi:hypothetical protein
LDNGRGGKTTTVAEGGSGGIDDGGGDAREDAVETDAQQMRQEMDSAVDDGAEI